MGGIPVGTGLVTTLERPGGGNLTGVKRSVPLTERANDGVVQKRVRGAEKPWKWAVLGMPLTPAWRHSPQMKRQPGY